MSASAETGAPALIVDHQAHWYPRACVEALVGRTDFPIAERTTAGGYVLWVDEGSA